MQRFTLTIDRGTDGDVYPGLAECDAGAWVRHADAEAELSALRGRVGELESQLRHKEIDYSEAMRLANVYADKLATLEAPPVADTMTASDWDSRTRRYTKYLRSRGHIVLVPGDTSPVAELVRAAVEMYDAGAWRHLSTGDTAIEFETWDTMAKAATDPNVRQWVERGRR